MTTGGGSMSGSIFISYRRDDSEGEAGRLYDDLIRIFGMEAVFMDVSDIHPGKDFRQAIDDNVAKCAVLLAIIGPGWTTVHDASGIRRLDQPNDFVRLEIASALTRGIDVIPILVHGARMPSSTDLPENLQSLAYRNCVELTHTRWNSDVEVLSRTLREYVNKGQEFATRSIRMAITGENPVVKAAAPKPDAEPAPPIPASRLLRTVAAFLAIVAAAILGAGAYSYIHHKVKHHEKKETQSSQPAPGHAYLILPLSPRPSAALRESC
jgi:hypothetical protein